MVEEMVRWDVWSSAAATSDETPASARSTACALTMSAASSKSPAASEARDAPPPSQAATEFCWWQCGQITTMPNGMKIAIWHVWHNALGCQRQTGVRYHECNIPHSPHHHDSVVLSYRWYDSRTMGMGRLSYAPTLLDTC